MLAESGLSAFIQTKCPLNSDPKWGLSIVSVLMSLTVMFTFRVHFTCTNYHLPLVFTFLALDFLLWEQGKHSNFKTKHNLFNREGNSTEELLYWQTSWIPHLWGKYSCSPSLHFLRAYQFDSWPHKQKTSSALIFPKHHLFLPSFSFLVILFQKERKENCMTFPSSYA